MIIDNKKHAIKKVINHIMKRKGRFPTLQEMCDLLQFNAEQTKKYMSALEEDGYLEKIGDWYKFSSAKIQEDVKPIIEEINIPKKEILIQEKQKDKNLTISSPIETTVKKNIKNSLQNKIINKSKIKIYGVPVYIIQFLMGIIGIGASIISIYYTTIWLFEFLPWTFALLLSSIMVGFSISAFETIILFMTGQVTESKIVKISVSLGFVVLWLMVTSFSIMSTVAGQYNKHVINLREQVKLGGGSDVATHELLREQKKDLTERLTEYRQQVSTLNKIISGMSDINTRTENDTLWRESQYRLHVANKNILKISQELNIVRENERKIILEGKSLGVSTKENIPNFYGWLSGIFLVSQDKIQFIMSLFPAIFVDIIAPVGIALSLFLRNKYKR